MIVLVVIFCIYQVVRKENVIIIVKYIHKIVKNISYSFWPNINGRFSTQNIHN